MKKLQNIEPLMISISDFLNTLKKVENEILTIKDKEKVEKLQIKIREMEKVILENVEILLNEKHKLINLINQIEDTNERTYLQEKFLNKKTNKEIAANMHYSIRNIYYLQEKAIKHLVELEKESIK